MQCDACKGTGEGHLVWSGGSAPEPLYTDACSVCNGSGEVVDQSQNNNGDS